MMGISASHKKLIAWQEAITLAELVYCVTAKFPRDETFGLRAQIRRSSVSISSNIAEGAARNSTRELVQFLGIASGSRAELDTQLEIASRLGLVPQDSEIFIQVERVGRLLTALRKSLLARL